MTVDSSEFRSYESYTHGQYTALSVCELCSHHKIVWGSKLSVMMTKWSLRFLENAVQEILKLVLSGLFVSLSLHWGKNNVDIVYLLELAWANSSAWDLLIVHSWHHSADFTLESTMTISNWADRIGASAGFFFVEDWLVRPGWWCTWVLAVEVQLLPGHLQVILWIVRAGAQMIGPDHLLTTALALWVFIRERSLNKVVAGVSVSIAITFKSTVEWLVSLLILVEWGFLLEVLEGSISLVTTFIRFSWSIGPSLLLSVVATLQSLSVLTDMWGSLLWVDTFVTRSIRVTYTILTLPMQIFSLLIKFLSRSDNHGWSWILHWLVSTHRMGWHTLMIWMHWHLHQVLLVWIWCSMLSHERRISLHSNMSWGMMWMHSIERMSRWTVSWWGLMICEMRMLWHFHWMARMVWHLAWMTVRNFHVRMLNWHCLWMHDLWVALSRMLRLDARLLDILFLLSLVLTGRDFLSVVSTASFLLLRVLLGLLEMLLLLLLLL